MEQRGKHFNGNSSPHAPNGVHAAQRLVVPLFQRKYVWNQENQWEPLWSDVVRVADRLLKGPQDKHQPHFLGAVVLQQVQNPIGRMQTWTIIDGQQRITTLQPWTDEAIRVRTQELSEVIMQIWPVPQHHRSD